ncbi:protein MODIFIER OF SNC1 1 isoform X2 [Nicotiana tomentosiformis]|uniref:protein MODIFIER OF SNC1 1 isoform X2 n=1 Tax=Nicotiana tomentosiformis TaxID=4098 RepID=UPI00051BDFC0|nr:protein MODIFIER OF SNC1 1 [Nicotiana tomentosiformis]XP_009595598.1 protein MODIFIER OF SNC1 1 [Nicotiana tomentosiformis]
MTSSMLAGEKRWASTRRGGMTVLGKVAVPKPLNLPSQRLENHGLDPNVEIVPKGTLSWGSRTSSSTSNPWGCSTLSPNADCGTSSPSHLRSRPSSGGSGTRPSTAGSDRTQEPITSAWGTNSRPSSASGPLSSNKAPSTLARPRSAETRPGSSQLSRFADPVSEHPVAWGATATAERLGVLFSKNEGFSLSSGDFPTLGSDRDVSGKTTESQDRDSCSRPSSASGKVAQPLEKTTASHSDVKGETFEAWKRDGQSAEDGPQHGMEKWQGDPHHYLGPNVPPHHFDAWHGPPMNAPAGFWYRGPPGGPPYGAPVPPGGFPIEPFPYFRPPIPPPAIANTQPVPPPGPRSRGHHPRGGDMYRPQITDAYIRPNMPFRPGFYSGPVAFEGYYGPPMGYSNSNEREIPLMGMPPGPPVYNRYSGPNTPDPTITHARIGSHGANAKALPEGVESAHPDDAKGPYKVLLKHDAREEGETWEHSAPSNGPYPDRSFQRSLQKHERGGEHEREKELYSRRTTGSGNCYPRSYDDRGCDSSDNTKANSFEGINTMKVADGSWTKKPGYVESSGGAPPSSSAPERGSTPAVTSRDSSLMQKIEGLNAKVRASDGCYEAPYVSSEEDINKSELNPKVTNSINEVKGALVSFERTHTGTTGNKGGQLTATMSRRPNRGVQTKNDNLGKARSDSHDDGWRKRPIAAESSAVASATCLEPASNVHACEPGPQVEAAEQALTDIILSGEKESLSELHDSADNQAQRAKMKELARQRALQLQKEEEERSKQQKAKALAKLEELNRRMQAGDALSLKAIKDSSPDVMKQDLEGSSPPEPVVPSVRLQARNAALAAQCDVIDTSNHILDKGSEHTNPPIMLEFGTSIMVQSEIAIPQPQALLSKQDANRVATTHGKVACQSSDGGVVKHKRTSHKQRPNMTPKNMNEKSVLVSVTEVSKGHNDVNINDVPSTEADEVGVSAESNIVNNAKVAIESSAQQRRKGNRTNKNKQKLDTALPSPATPLPVQNDSNPAKVSMQQEKLNSSQLVLDVSSVQAASGDSVVQPSDQSSPLPTEEGHSRVINQWKPQHPRRSQRNQHPNVHTDKFHGGDTVVWAPVRSQSKTEDAAEASQKTASDSVGPLKSDNVVQSNSKSKRAEMERYVPKPVAKELAQHASSQPPLLLSGSSPGSDETTGRADSMPENLPTSSVIESFSIESRIGDGKHNNNRQGKAHGVWRQRGSADLALDTSKNTYKSLDHTSKNTYKPLDHIRSLKPDGDSAKSESKCSSEFDVSDGWNMPGDFEGPRTTIPVVKDEGTTGKGKRYPSKGHRSTGNSGHQYKNSSGETQQNHTLSGASDINQMDKSAAAKENLGMANRTPPHWQPKSHMLAVNNQQAGVSTRAQNVTMEGGRADKRDYHQDKVNVPLHGVKGSSDKGMGQSDQLASEDKIVSEVPNVGNLDPRRERKPSSFRGRPYSPNQGPVVKAELPPAESAEAMQERSNSGLRRNVNQNNLPARMHESCGDMFSGRDNRQHSTSSGRERRRNNMHYEYQPVGQYSDSKSSNFEGPADGSHNVGQRYRERGQGQSKRGGGNFHSRQGGSGRINANYD